MNTNNNVALTLCAICLIVFMDRAIAADFPKPYGAPRVERENVFEFTQKPKAKYLGDDKYYIKFAIKGYCDVTVGIVDAKGVVVRHLGSGVLGKNAPPPFQKNELKQTIFWDGKDDLGDYVKEPGKLHVRVMLGLKPVFDKRLGGVSAKNLPGVVAGMVIGPDSAYVIIASNLGGFGHGTIRKFDRDGNYSGTILPPPADIPESKLGGMGYVEYEPGKRALHGPDLGGGFSGGSHYAPSYSLDAWNVQTCSPVVSGKRLVFPNAGALNGSPGSFIHYIGTDGSTDVRGMNGIVLNPGYVHENARLGMSPDGKKVYVGGMVKVHRAKPTCVMVCALESDEPAKVFAGKLDTPGSDNAHFAEVKGIDCDTNGRVYVADRINNRIQIFSPEGKFLKTIRIERPDQICIHKKTDAIYVMHGSRVQGKSVGRVTKLASFADPREEFHWDGVAGLMALDSWSDRPRLWLSGKIGNTRGTSHFGAKAVSQGTGSVTIWEERDRKFEKIQDFQEAYIREAGESWFGRWDGVGTLVMNTSMTFCDPTREKAYYKNYVFDLKTGKCEGRWKTDSGKFDEIAFDKRGYMHGHQNCRAKIPCVWRVDPDRAVKKKIVLSPGDKRSMSARKARAYQAMDVTYYPECPYDYGEQKAPKWIGALPTRCQAGAKGFQDGLGVNMRGEVAVESNICYVPKMDDLARISATGSSSKVTNIAIPGGKYNEEGLAFEAFLKSIKESQKKGVLVYSIKRKPGIPLSDATIWIFDTTGELMSSKPMVIGGLMNGLNMDEDGDVYFTMNRTRWLNGRRFLNGKSGRFGMPGGRKTENPNSSIFTGTYTKAKPGKLTVWMNNAPIPMDELPKRGPDVRGSGDHHSNGDKIWMEGADWLYAGASPIVVSQPCSCFQLRAHLDWYKRSYVPEVYRHSIGVLDSNGNLIMHLGRYANFDTAPGGKGGAKLGETNIGLTSARFISGTDNYLAFEDWGERMVVLKLKYEAEETVRIKMK